jgi:predicted dehydrogenase/threonine dehydrogenase-like Zn-dependent dehydrogenase
MIQALVKKGKVTGEIVPAPVVSDGSLLIKVVNSCISAGTEISSVETSGKSLIKRAIEQPEKVAKIFNMIKSDGLKSTYEQVKGRLGVGSPTGYSISGVVLGVGKGVTKFQVGDHIAAAGAGLANHAEFVDVPENLVMKINKDMSFIDASTVTLGGIALQGIRRSDLRLGEFCVVVGTGLLGLLTIQMLQVSGIRVIALDLDEDRLKLGKELGANFVINPKNEDPVKAVYNITEGYGADAVIFTAATISSEPLSQAFKMCKRKGRVVLVGVTGMTINRSDIYPKELDFLISSSYGPGRYDKNYEEKGLDYPYSYVRWTENRNMSEYLRLLYEGKVKLDKMISKIYAIEKVTEAFDSLLSSETKPLMVILDYGKIDDNILETHKNILRKIEVNKKIISNKSIVKVALIGAGGFATGVHLPNILKLADKFSLHAVVDKIGSNAKVVAQQFKATYSSTDIEEIVKDEKVDLVMITTRHDNHAELALKFLQAGKHVFVEKPLAVNQQGINGISDFYKNNTETPKPILMVGFNRRFSKYSSEIKKHTSKRINPLFINYKMNAGYIPLDHWVHEHGGRIIGEACHIIDLMTYFTESTIESISYESLTSKTEKYSSHDNKSIILKYLDGSICTINYFSTGSKEYPKEIMEIHFDEKTIIMDDYKTLKGYGVKVEALTSQVSQKGHYEELLALYNSILNRNKNWPINLSELIETTCITMEIAQCVE